MECRYCGARNEPDRTTCVLCGRTLEAPKEEIETVSEPEPEQVEAAAPQEEPDTPRSLAPEEHIRIGELIYAAYKDKEAGALDDAIMACQGALALNESSAPAHSLLGSLYEAKGDIPSAIYEYEKVERLDPGNVANRQKLEDLRRSAESPMGGVLPRPAIRYEKLLPYLPYAVLILIFALMIGAGFMALAKYAKKANGGENQQFQGQGIPQTTNPVQPYSGSPYPQGQSNTVQNQQFAGPGQVQPTETPRPSTSAPKATTRPTALPGSRPVWPIQPFTQPAPGSQPPVITPIIESPKPKPKPNPQPKPAPVEPPTPQPVGDPEERAVQLQQAGKFSDAITAYRDALDRTSDSGRIYQQIAICHQRLGHKDQAIQNYRSAIRSFRDQLSAGRDPTEVQRNIRSCEAGIDALSGP